MKNCTTLLFMLFSVGLSAQTTLQVVTKTVQKSFAWKPGNTLEVNGEKSEIEIEVNTADPNTISIKAELTTRHPRLDTAKIDLEAWKFTASQVGNAIFVRACIAVPNGKPVPTSNLKAKITLKVPAACAITLSNKLGKAQLRSLQGPLKLSGEFCEFTLRNIKNKVQINSQYGNIIGDKIDGEVNIQSKRAEINLNDIRKDCSFRCEYGSVNIENLSPNANITIDGGKTDVTITLAEQSQQNIDLKASHGNLDLPLYLHLDPAAVASGQSFKRTLGKKNARIKVETNFGKITIH